MSDSDQSSVNPLDALAEEFVERHRRGENPSVSAYIAKYPELANDIRDLFPGLLLMEDVRPESGPGTRPFALGSAIVQPERLGDYRILREVGRGGMGVVYEAEQLSLGRHVALKVLPAAGLMPPTFLERFRREAKAAARLHHTNIVPVYGVGEAGGVHFYAMQFIQGQSLDQVLHDVRKLRNQPSYPSGFADLTRTRDEGSLAQELLTGQFELAPAVFAMEKAPQEPGGSPAAALTKEGGAGSAGSTGLTAGNAEMQYFRSVARIGLQAADALTYAHRQGILHRDVKPSNLLLDQQGTVWITDFGLAKAEGSEELTNTGDIVGTVRFMAPERFEGLSLPQSDVYGLGLTLYEMLTLRPAFNAPSRPELIEKVLHQEPPALRRIDAKVPRDLETIVLKCLTKDPQGRYTSAEMLADDLRLFLTDRPIRARRASVLERLWRWCRRNPFVASLLSAVLLLLLIIIVRSTVSAARLQTALTHAQQAEGEARLREADALAGQAHGIRYSRRPGQRFEALDALSKAAAIGRETKQSPKWFDRLRNEAIAALALPDIHITHTWNGFPPGTWRADVSPDFELYARTTKQGACSIRRIADDSIIADLPERGEPVYPVFGPGRWLTLFGESSKRFQLWDVREQEAVLFLEKQSVVVQGASFSPDGKQLLLSFVDGSLGLYETATGQCRHSLLPDKITKECRCELHPTEPYAATYTYWKELLQVRDLRTGKVCIEMKPLWKGGFGKCAWSPDGRTLAMVHGNGLQVRLYAFDPAQPSLRQLHLLTGTAALRSTVQFNPAGDRLVVRGSRGVVHLLDAVNGQRLFSTPVFPVSARNNLRFDLSGGRLASALVGPRQQQLGVWSVADAREYRTLLHHGPQRPVSELSQYEYLPAVHPGGRLVAFRLPNGVGLFDLENGRELAFISLAGGCRHTCFDAAGNLYISSRAESFRWPVRPDPIQLDRLIVGPPERLPFPADTGIRFLALSQDGRAIARASIETGGWILHPKAPKPRRIETERCRWSRVSPNGRWGIFSTNQGYFKVYETATGRCVRQFESGPSGFARFSADGRWLLTDDEGGRVYAVGTWEPGTDFGPGIPWDVSPDSRLLTVGQTDGVYRLIELATGREVARLEDPEQLAVPAVFTSDGTRLVAAAGDGLRIWDLRRIRVELGKLGLDWEALPYPEASDDTPSPIEVKIVAKDPAAPDLK